MDEDIVIALIFGMLGLTLFGGLALRVAVKPLVDSIARLLEVRANNSAVDSVDKRLAALERELRALRIDQRRILQQSGAATKVPENVPEAET